MNSSQMKYHFSLKRIKKRLSKCTFYLVIALQKEMLIGKKSLHVFFKGQGFFDFFLI